jgi:H+/gluconate symporter-like permease
VLTSGVHHLLRERLSRQRLWLATAGTYAVYAVALLAFLPPNPDPVQMPADLVAAFRTLSLIGLTLFWLVLGVVFGLVLRALDRPRSIRTADPVPSPGR